MILTTLTALYVKKKLACAALVGGAVFGAGLVVGAALTQCAARAPKTTPEAKT